MGQVFAKMRHEHASSSQDQLVMVREAGFYFVLGVRKCGRRGHKSTARTRWKCRLFVSCKHQEEEKI
jgi:hypothetical protein